MPGDGVTERPAELHPLAPGQRIEGDWFDRVVPTNIAIGAGTQIDSSHSFYFYSSKLACGLRTGRNVTFWRSAISVSERGCISIGDDCYFSNASLVCEEAITVGDRVMVATGVTIADCDFHPTEPAARIADTIALSPGGDRSKRPKIKASPVTIGNDVWIGPNAVILKGVSIGDGAYIAPGSVVVADVAPGGKVAGNPARPLEDRAE